MTRAPGAIGHVQRVVELRPVGPYRLDLTVWALRRRAHNRLDAWDGRYRRGLLLDDQPATIEVHQDSSAPAPAPAPSLTLTVTTSGEISPAQLDAAVGATERLLGLGTNLQGFYDVADRDAHLRPLKDRFLGVRPPRFPTLFEALANAVANQQLTLEVGIELLNRLTDAFGIVTPHPDHPTRTFAPPEAIAGSSTGPLRDLGFSTRKAEYLIGLAEAVLTDEIDAEALDAAERPDATEQLTALRGIGRWSAEYVLLRGLGRLDVFPGDDVGARNKLERFLDLGAPPDYAQIISILEPWRPFAGMVYFHLLLDGLAERGVLDDTPDRRAQSSTGSL